MKRRKHNILLVVALVIASLVMSVLPHHHHHELICFERIECEMDHAVNDEHTGHEHSDDSHPESCITSVSYLPQHWLKLAILCLGISLLFWASLRLLRKIAWREDKQPISSPYFLWIILTGGFSVRDGRAPPFAWVG